MRTYRSQSTLSSDWLRVWTVHDLEPPPQTAHAIEISSNALVQGFVLEVVERKWGKDHDVAFEDRGIDWISTWRLVFRWSPDSEMWRWGKIDGTIPKTVKYVSLEHTKNTYTLTNKLKSKTSGASSTAEPRWWLLTGRCAGATSTIRR